MNQRAGVEGRRLDRVTRSCASAALATAAATALGWRWHLDVLRSWVPGAPRMALATALGVSLCAIGLLALSARQARPGGTTQGQAPRPRGIPSGLALLPGVLVLILVSVRGLVIRKPWGSDIDGLLIDGLIGNLEPAAMSPATAVALTLTAVGQMLSIERRFARLLEIVVVTNGAGVLLLLLTVLTGAPQLPAIRTMAPSTAAAILLLNVGLLTLNPDSSFVRYLTSRHSGGQLLRSVLAPALVLPALTLIVGRYGVQAGVIPPLSVPAVDAWLLALLVAALVCWTAVKLERASGELSKSQAYAALSLDAIACAVVMVDRNGRVEFANRTAYQMFGFDSTLILGGPFERLVPGLSSHWPLAEDPRTSPTETPVAPGSGLDLFGRRRDGSVFPVEVALSPMLTATGPMILATVIDASALRLLAERDARLAAIVASSDDAIIGKDLQGTVTSWNHAAERVFGYNEHEMIGKNIAVLLPPDRRADELLILERIRRGEYIDSTVVKRCTKQGTLIDVSLSVSPIRGASGNIIGAAKIARDVTTVLALEVTVNSQQVRLKTLLETASDGLHVLDTHGNLMFFSDSFASLLGYTKEETQRLNLHDWEMTRHDQPLEEHIKQVTLHPAMLESRVLRKDGTVIDVEINQKGIWLENNNYLYCSARDVTGRKRAERESQRYVRELERINGELDQFVYVASHDLRSPLRAVTSLVQWIAEDDSTLAPTTKERLDLIRSRVQRLSVLLDDIRDYARSRDPLEDSGPVLTAATLTADLAATLGREGFDIVADASLNDIEVSRTPLDRILHNLIDNALKHHDKPHGTVTVAAAATHLGLRFSVADDGPGIAEKYRSTVFELFKTLRPRDEVEGSGMGLALVRKIVEQRGGRCGVLANGERGAVFWFDWPRRPDATQ